ncbi:hypothetical protein [Mesorhizobium waimense]|uniref:hypothetical protein n=1 Tax=Mesorhizobium waimense TaxID=1300307 RepID=UPI00142E8C43|nr:hypothetical protein [Mesorhizobium waimense]
MADSKMIPTGRRYCNAQFRIANAKVTTSLPGNKPDGSICPQGASQADLACGLAAAAAA